ncbi:386_t:CDS:1, partial [Racocetra persica]
LIFETFNEECKSVKKNLMMLEKRSCDKSNKVLSQLISKIYELILTR